MSTFLFIGKQGDHYVELAANTLKEYFPNQVLVVLSNRGKPIPQECYEWRGDYIISYVSHWIIPQEILENAKIAAINFHPGPPEYPGIGCTNFAIYNREKEFGITCHHMLAKVDTGNIIEVRKFPLLEHDSVFTLTQKCYIEINKLFVELITKIYNNEELPKSEEGWKRKPYTRKQLNALCKIDLNASDEEILHRIKSTTYTRPWAFVEIVGKKFIYDGN